MLEKPAFADELILSAVREQYRLHPTQVTFLPLGYDVNTAVYRVDTTDGTSYFLKLRSGEFNQVSVVLPSMLTTRGVQSIIAPLVTKDNQPWGSLAEYKLILYPFIEGRDGYQMALSEQQWLDFGTALNGIHTAKVPPVLSQLLPQETYSPRGRAAVKRFQAQVENIHFTEPVAMKLAAFMEARRDEIRKVVDRAETLSQRLRKQPPVLVLCHADIHPGNLLISPHGEVYIVDWDAPILAPKERDLALIGGCSDWSSPGAQDLFYRGYGTAEIKPEALAYYRYERIVQDMAEFCQQLLLTNAGGEDREQSFQFFASCFLPGNAIELANNAFMDDEQ